MPIQTPKIVATGLARRQMLRCGLVAGAGLLLSGTGMAAPVVATASALTPYQRRVMLVAQRERDRLTSLLLDNDLVAVADFAQPSSLPRLHFVNLAAGTVQSHLVSHGRGSDPAHVGWLKHFSNDVGSLATSRGAYLTCEQYDGKYGPSLRLRGLDLTNSNAHDRAIVMHPAWYAAPDMLAKYGKLGRSEGCFAMAPEDFGTALHRLGSGHLLFADRIGEV
jgi:hypothetical protein